MPTTSKLGPSHVASTKFLVPHFHKLPSHILINHQGDNVKSESRRRVSELYLLSYLQASPIVRSMDFYFLSDENFFFGKSGAFSALRQYGNEQVVLIVDCECAVSGTSDAHLDSPIFSASSTPIFASLKYIIPRLPAPSHHQKGRHSLSNFCPTPGPLSVNFRA